jgi:hypothetical protein
MDIAGLAAIVRHAASICLPGNPSKFVATGLGQVVHLPAKQDGGADQVRA